MISKKVRFKRGQAALEFLSTYAWAFVIILIVIGALTYFGVGSPQSLLPDRCNFNAEFSCENHVVNSGTNDITLKIRNNAGTAVTLQNFIIDGEEGYSCTSTDRNLVAGNTTDVTFTSCGLGAAGVSTGSKTKFRVDFDWFHIKDGSNFAKKGRGEVISTAN